MVNCQSIQKNIDKADRLKLDRQDVQYVLEDITGIRAGLLRFNTNYILTKYQQQNFDQALKRLFAHEPLPYILGYQAFWDFDLKVSPNVLIPRPDTEILIEIFMKYANLKYKSVLKILELGTGSGAIAMTIKKNMPHVDVWALDYSVAALQIARDNIHSYQLDIHLFASYWLNAVNSQFKFDAIISNPPYIAEDDFHLKQPSMQYEPLLALQSGKDGFNALQQIIRLAKLYLKDQGILALEHGFEQARKLKDLLIKYGYRHIRSYPDLKQRDRVIFAIKG